MVGALLSE